VRNTRVGSPFIAKSSTINSVRGDDEISRARREKEMMKEEDVTGR